MTDPAIAVLPYGMKFNKALADLSLDRLMWPLGCPERLSGKKIRDLAASDHLIVHAKTALHFRSLRACPAQISFMVLEPKIMSAKHHLLLRLSHRRFFRVFSYDEDLLASVPNGQFLPFGTTWVPEWEELSIEKSKDLSLIASEKRDHPGHKLRHEIVGYLEKSSIPVDIMGRGYTPFEEKSDGLAPYRYSVVIENVRERNYFSEKLIDAILCETVPIYWGCPNISDFLDPSAMMICETEKDIKAAIAAMSIEDYQARLPILRASKPRAAEWADLYFRAAEALRKND